MKTVFVSGASGFIGGRLVQSLIEAGVRVRVLLRNSKNGPFLPRKSVLLEEVVGNLFDVGHWESSLEGVDTVFHLGGQVTARSEAEFLEINAIGSRHIGQAVKRRCPDLKRFIYVSSLAAAGPAISKELPCLESHQAQPVSAYGRSKLAGEQELSVLGLPLTIVRPPMVYGPQDAALLTVVKMVQKGVVPVIRASASSGSGQKWYSSIEVDDLCQGLIALAPGGAERDGIFYLASNQLVSYPEILRCMASALGRRAPIMVPISAALLPYLAGVSEFFGRLSSKTGGKVPPLNSDKVHELRPDAWVCSSQKAQQLLSWSPRYEFQDGIRKAIAWYQKNGWL